MRKLMLIATVALMSFSGGRTAFVCMSDTSVAYHATKRCKGLYKCSHEIREMTESEAKKLGKRPCHLCW